MRQPAGKRAGGRALDLDVSALLIAERLLGEILGWDLVDWSAVLPHRGRKFSFARRHRGHPSIHEHLAPLLDRCAPANGDFSPLRPSPAVNSCLATLVGWLCCHIGKHALPDPRTHHRALERTAEQDDLHHAVVDRLLGRIGGHAVLGERAARLKRIASAAEGELERHFADLISGRLENGFLPRGAPDRQKLDGLRRQAGERIEDSRRLNARELAGLSQPALGLDRDRLIRIEMARILLGRFPYLRNYELMLMAELAMLQRPLTPRFAPERMLAQKAGRIDAALIEHLDRTIADLERRGADGGARARPGAPAVGTIALCGSGSLPMTAIFLHLLAGASVVLIDRDGDAVERSRRLIGHLERLEIIEPGALTICPGDAGDVAFRAAGRPQAARGDAVACDAVLVASLLDTDAKASIARQVADAPDAPELLIMRSATGLSAQLAYDAVPTEAVSRGGLAYCGEMLPAAHIATRLDRTAAALRQVACIASPDVLAIAHPEVVNTTEVYRRIAAGPKAPGLDFAACRSVEDWIGQLDSVRSVALADQMGMPDRA